MVLAQYDLRHYKSTKKKLHVLNHQESKQIASISNHTYIKQIVLVQRTCINQKLQLIAGEVLWQNSSMLER